MEGLVSRWKGRKRLGDGNQLTGMFFNMPWVPLQMTLLPLHFRTLLMATLWTLSFLWTSPFRGTKLSNPFLWPQPSTSFPFSHSVSLCQLLLIPWPLPGFLSSPVQPGVSHTLTSIPVLSFLPLCPPTSQSVPRPRWSNLVTSPIPNHSQVVRVYWKSCFPRWLCQQCFYLRLVVSICHAPRWLSKPSPLSDISCCNLSALRRHPPQYKHRLWHDNVLNASLSAPINT